MHFVGRAAGTRTPPLTLHRHVRLASDMLVHVNACPGHFRSGSELRLGWDPVQGHSGSCALGPVHPGVLDLPQLAIPQSPSISRPTRLHGLLLAYTFSTASARRDEFGLTGFCSSAKLLQGEPFNEPSLDVTDILIRIRVY